MVGRIINLNISGIPKYTCYKQRQYMLILLQMRLVLEHLLLKMAKTNNQEHDFGLLCNDDRIKQTGMCQICADRKYSSFVYEERSNRDDEKYGIHKIS